MEDFGSRPEHVNSETAGRSGFSSGIFGCQITVTFGAGKTQSVWRDRRTMPFGAFIGELAHVEIGDKDGRCYVPAVFTGTARKMDFAERIEIAVLDSDCGYTRAEIATALQAEGLAGFVHSTASHLKDTTEVSAKSYNRWRGAEGADFDEAVAPAEYLKEYKGYLSRVSDGARVEGTSASGKEYVFRHQPIPKFRIIMPLARPWVATDYPDAVSRHADWRARILAVAALLGLHSDQSCTDASRLFYTPRVKGAAAVEAFESEFIDGAALDIHALQPIAEPQAEPKPRRARARQQGAPDREPKKAPEIDDDPNRFRIGALDLRRWYASTGHGFEITKALKTRGKAPFGNRVRPPKYHLECPFDDYHTAAGDRTGMFTVDASKRAAAGMPAITDGFIAKCKHDACAHRDRLDHLKRMVELGWLTVDDLTDSRFLSKEARKLEELAPFDLSKRTGERAGRTVRRLMKRFCRELKTHLKARDFRRTEAARLREEAGIDATDQDHEVSLDEVVEEAHADAEQAKHLEIARKVYRMSRRRFGPAKRPNYQIAGGAGTGKTWAFIECYRNDPELWRYHIRIAEQTRAMCKEVADKINANAPEGMPLARTIAGRDARGMCEYGDRAQRIGGQVRSTFGAMCCGPTGRCGFFDTCGYNQQFTASDAHKPRVYVVTHHRLRVGQPAEIALPEPDLVIVDESAIGTLTESMAVDPEAFGREEAYHGNQGDQISAPMFADLGREVAAVIMTGGDILKRLNEKLPPTNNGAALAAKLRGETPKINAFGTAERLEEAAEAASRAADRNGGITPNDEETTIGAKLERIQRAASEGVSRVLFQLARDIRCGAQSSLAVQWYPARKDEDGNDLPGRIMHHGKRAPAGIPKSAALLLLDADAIPEVNRILFGRDLRTFRVEGQRLGIFIQCSSGEFPKSTLLAKTDSPNQIARSASLLGRFLAFARAEHATGKKVLIITNKPVHRELRRLAGIADPEGPLGAATRIEIGLEITHFGAYTGIDAWKDFDTAIIIGREQPKAEAVEEMARRIYGDLRGMELALPGKYIEAIRRYRANEPVTAELRTHPDLRGRALLELMRERMSCQGIDRLRLMYPRPDGRVPRVYIFCSIPLPGIVPDMLATADHILAGGSRIERAVTAGFVTENAAVMHKQYPEPAMYPTEEAAHVDIKRAGQEIAQVIENKEKGQTAHSNTMSNLTLTLKINGLADSWHPGAFRRRSADGWAPRWSRFGFSTLRHHRLDITLARHYGAAHIDEIEFRGHAADALQRARAMDEARGFCRSLSPLTDADREALDPRTREGQTAIIRVHFAMSPRLTILLDGTELWRDGSGKPIPRPIDAWPAPEQKPTRGNLFHARNPHLAQIREDGAVMWLSRDGREVPGPVGGLDAMGDDVLAEHQTAVAAMTDDELVAAIAHRSQIHGDSTALAARLRAYAARSPAHAREVFLPGRWPKDAA